MATLQVEHAISDFGVWKTAFEADPVRRKESGVRRYRVFRPVDDSRYVKIDLDFDSDSSRLDDGERDEALWREPPAERRFHGASARR